MGIDCQRSGEDSGEGIGRGIAECVGNAKKEASTNAMKRAARTLGGSFGLQLYRTDGVAWGKVGHIKQPHKYGGDERMFAEAIADAKDAEALQKVALEIKDSKLNQGQRLRMLVRMRRRQGVTDNGQTI